MKNSLLIFVVVVLALASIAAIASRAGSSSADAVADALREQNKQLSRIAASLERIAGQQPGWKLPK